MNPFYLLLLIVVFCNNSYSKDHVPLFKCCGLKGYEEQTSCSLDFKSNPTKEYKPGPTSPVFTYPYPDSRVIAYCSNIDKANGYIEPLQKAVIFAKVLDNNIYTFKCCNIKEYREATDCTLSFENNKESAVGGDNKKIKFTQNQMKETCIDRAGGYMYLQQGQLKHVLFFPKEMTENCALLSNQILNDSVANIADHIIDQNIKKGQTFCTKPLSENYKLEAMDPKHRYGNDLTRYWYKINGDKDKDKADKSFFDMVSTNLTEIPEVKYFNKKEKEESKLILKNGRTTQDVSRHIFVLDSEGEIYTAKKGTIEGTNIQINHSSMLAGQPAASAGYLDVDDNGEIVTVIFESGHYFPSDEEIINFFEALKRKGADLDKIDFKERVHDHGTTNALWYYNRNKVKYCSSSAKEKDEDLDQKITPEQIWHLEAKGDFIKAEKGKRELINYLKSYDANIKSKEKTTSGKTKDSEIIVYPNGISAIKKKEGSQTNPYAEVVGYKLSELIGLHTVPPTTIIRNDNGETYSVQVLVNAWESNYAAEYVDTIPDELLRNTKDTLFFDALLANSDRSSGNYMISKEKFGDNYKQILIDNGLGLKEKLGTGSVFGYEDFVIQSEIGIENIKKYIPSDLIWNKFKNLNRDQISELFTDVQDEQEKNKYVDQMWKRYKFIKEKIMLYKNQNK